MKFPIKYLKILILSNFSKLTKYRETMRKIRKISYENENLGYKETYDMKIQDPAAGKMAPWSRMLVALLKHQVQFPMPILDGSQPFVTQTPRYSHAFLAPIFACTHECTHIKIKYDEMKTMMKCARGNQCSGIKRWSIIMTAFLKFSVVVWTRNESGYTHLQQVF